MLCVPTTEFQTSLLRRTAIERLPELAKEIGDATSPAGAWMAIEQAFQAAYDAEPKNQDLISRVYAYADWRMKFGHKDEGDSDVRSVVDVCFYEMIPGDRKSLLDMPRWFTFEQAMAMRKRLDFVATDEQWEEVLRLYDLPLQRLRRALKR